jgi:maleate isomerase
VITVGVLTPHATAGPESEFTVLAPEHVRVDVARIQKPVSSSGGEPPATAPDLRALATPQALDAAASVLPEGSFDVLAWASTSSAYAIGYDAESALVNGLGARWAVPACSTSASAVSALRSRRIQRISLVHPPWFGAEQNQLGATYFDSQGFQVLDARLAELPNDPDQIEPPMVVEWVSQHVSDRAEAVILGGNGFRAAGAVQELEDRLGRLVLASNQVLLWSVLHSLHVAVDIDGFGMLFEHAPHRRRSARQATPGIP